MKKHIKRPLLVLLFTLMLFKCSNDDDSAVQSSEPETVTDADGNVYNTIKMGNQIWMLENLKTTKYNDGSSIVQYNFDVNGINWGSINNQEAFYRWPDTNDLNNVVDEELPFDYYGAMYNHWAIESGKLAPDGWRIPTEADFVELVNFLANEGHTGNEATVLKTETGWLPSSENGTNLYGFNTLPNGYVNAFGGPTLAEGTSTWATSNVNGVNPGSQTRKLITIFNNGPVNFDDSAIQIGAGIRCIKIQ
ncbi:FISUMP domain-containing protein [uncultured Lacinutrix sp.]|uniref:FISUMP domain-containing protein n=1 Tax=uncultured Lacinutrix sp. TaxID=574032 RepID=UPI00260F23E2|nr:FISUMP domain-containing protein [uncultured Lacinutrix sp.]